MIAYVVLIVLVLGMAAAVYGYLKFYVPKNQPSCPADVSLSIEELSCNGGNLNITLKNRGLFSIDGAYVKVGEGRHINKMLLCLNSSLGESSPDCVMFHKNNDVTMELEALKLGASWNSSLTYSSLGAREVEVQPLVIFNNVTRVLCNAVVTHDVICT